MARFMSKDRVGSYNFECFEVKRDMTQALGKLSFQKGQAENIPPQRLIHSLAINTLPFPVGTDSTALLWGAPLYAKASGGQTCQLLLQGRSLFLRAGRDQTLGANIAVPIAHQHPMLLLSGLQPSAQPRVGVTNQLYVMTQQEEIIPKTSALIKSSPRDSNYNQKSMKAEQFCTWCVAQVGLGAAARRGAGMHSHAPGLCTPVRPQRAGSSRRGEAAGMGKEALGFFSLPGILNQVIIFKNCGVKPKMK